MNATTADAGSAGGIARYLNADVAVVRVIITAAAAWMAGCLNRSR